MTQAPSTIHMAKREHFQSRVVLNLTQATWCQEDSQCRVVPKRMRGPKNRHQVAATPGFKSQCQSSSAAPFPAPPTIGHSCQHSRQVWLCGVEPIISKLFWTPLQIPIWGPPPGCTLLHHQQQRVRISNPSIDLQILNLQRASSALIKTNIFHTDNKLSCFSGD